ncbi:hypothetical protein ACFOY2_49115 [Nonomuraea purpurea]|uniref:Uncharacterized protein n=1 Tax=Nonomuraea purpurea TaxID=1849276 RepID=A0ABV8GQN3_9ACTN
MKALARGPAPSRLKVGALAHISVEVDLRLEVRRVDVENSRTSIAPYDDLFCLLWLAGIASRDPHAPAGWRRAIERSFEAAWTSST